MDEIRKQFKNITTTNTAKSPVVRDEVKNSQSIAERLGVKVTTINIENGVKLVLAEDEEEDYTKIFTLEDVIKLDKKKPNLIVEFVPPLFKEYTNARAEIKTHVKVNDEVVVKDKFVHSSSNNDKTKVLSLHFKSLNNMTVIIAKLSNNNYELSNRLEVCK
jgi:hypothetical protein